MQGLMHTIESVTHQGCIYSTVNFFLYRLCAEPRTHLVLRTHCIVMITHCCKS